MYVQIKQSHVMISLFSRLEGKRIPHSFHSDAKYMKGTNLCGSILALSFEQFPGLYERHLDCRGR